MRKTKYIFGIILICSFFIACNDTKFQIDKREDNVKHTETDDLDKLYEDIKRHVKKDVKETISYEEAEFVRMVDGDTMIVRLKGSKKEERLRLLMIDTPECVAEESWRNGRFGEMASEFSKEIVENRLRDNKIYLVKDVSDRDQYGRLLRYVFLEKPSDDTLDTWIRYSLNAIMLYEGYANVVTFPPDVSQKDFFLALNKYARDNDRGLFSFTDERDLKKAQEIDNKSHSEKKNNEGLAYEEANGRIIGNKNSMYYHIEGGDGYKLVKAKNAVYFDTEEEAIKAGYKKAPSRR